jgi:hypothetical protein
MEIVVTQKWCHPEFGGTRINEKRFQMSEGEKACEYFNKLEDENSNSGGMEHHYIEIQFVI